MKAMILAAGLGTRLRTLTENRPKALMPVINRPVIARNIDYLKSCGVRSIAVNAFHHSGRLIEYLDKGRPFDVDMDVRVEKELLGTGGGIQNFADFLRDESFIVLNADILTDISLSDACRYHLASGCPVTLILHDYEPFNKIMINRKSQVVDIARQKTKGGMAFTGIHILAPDILGHIPGPGYSDIIDCYRSLIETGIPIAAYVSEGHYWRDIGSPESYLAANRDFLAFEKKESVAAPDSSIDRSARINGSVIGEKTSIGPGAVVERSVIWDNVVIKGGVRVINSVVTSSKELDHDIIGEII